MSINNIGPFTKSHLDMCIKTTALMMPYMKNMV